MKKFRIIISMLFTIILLMGCGGGGDSGDSRAITPQVKYDATGTWDFQAYDHHVVCNGIRCDICDDEGVRIFNEFKEIQEVQVIQNNDKFQMTYNGETEEGTIEGDFYTFSGSYQETYEGVTVTVNYTCEITLEDDYYFQGNIEYRTVTTQGVDCNIWVYFRGWREGCRVPKVRIEPVVYDFGTVEWQEQAEAEFIVYNDAHPDYGNSLSITAGPTFEDHTNFVFNWDKYTGLGEIPAGGSGRIYVIYKPTEWNIEHSTNMWFDCNDPDMPHVTVPLVGKATSSMPKIKVTVEGECATPPDTHEGIYMCFSEQDACTGESEPQTVKIENVGSEDLDIKLTDGISTCVFPAYYNGVEFGYSGIFEITIQSGDFIIIEVTYKPNIDGHTSWDSFNIKSNDPNSPLITVRPYGYSTEAAGTVDCREEYCPNWFE